MRMIKSYAALLFAPADARVYAAFRMAFSLTVLLNLLDLFQHRKGLFHEGGLIAFDFVRSLCAGAPYWSVFYWVEGSTGIDVLFMLTCTAAWALFFGLFTRLALLIVYVWQVSYLNTLFPVLSGWDSVLTLCAFILLISPSAEAWSLDGQIKKILFRRAPASSVPVYGLLLLRYQLCLIYFTTALLKMYNPWWRSGEFFAYYLLSVYSRFAQPWIAENLWLSVLLTYSTLVVEFALPLLLLFKKTRPFAFIAGIGMHVAILITSRLSIFSFIMIALYIPWLKSMSFTGNLLKMPSAKPTC
ncbi:MAG: hypothetical protein KatS3mg031_1560 [Chitinophagales bacterium]|nr:MAG: hypothetical protein KatS3mg031_1560 [Chitinophagales bacterium]